MAKLKTVPKALIVAGIVGAAGFGVYKFMGQPESQPQLSQVQQPTQVATVVAQPAQAPVVRTEPPVVQAAPVVQQPQYVPPAQAAVEEPRQAVQTAQGKLPGAGIASGEPSGSYYPIVNDIVKSCSTQDYPLRNVRSAGSVDNANKIYTDPNTQFGVVQANILQYLKQQDPKMMSRVVAIFPFYSEEIHAVTSSGSPIRTIADLEGKRVAEGQEGSGTWATVQQLKQLSNINWTSAGNLSQAESIKAVQTGGADVAFIVGGQPLQVLSGATGLKLVSLQNPKIDSANIFTKATIPSGTYPWQAGATNTYKVDNVLATFAYKNQYQTEIANLVSCIVKNVDNLQANGHPKWRDVDPLDIERVKWAVHPAALAVIKREAKKK
jgi:TRAP transporter TAXI family solute receptor